jgi:hypothetical protein
MQLVVKPPGQLYGLGRAIWNLAFFQDDWVSPTQFQIDIPSVFRLRDTFGVSIGKTLPTER